MLGTCHLPALCPVPSPCPVSLNLLFHLLVHLPCPDVACLPAFLSPYRPPVLSVSASPWPEQAFGTLLCPYTPWLETMPGSPLPSSWPPRPSSAVTSAPTILHLHSSSVLCHVPQCFPLTYPTPYLARQIFVHSLSSLICTSIRKPSQTCCPQAGSRIPHPGLSCIPLALVPAAMFSDQWIVNPWRIEPRSHLLFWVPYP